MITPGEAHDTTAYRALMDEDAPEPKVLIADRGYDADPIRSDVESRGATPVIPTKRNRKVQIATDAFIYAPRNRIERGINKLKNARGSQPATIEPRSATSASSNLPQSASGSGTSLAQLRHVARRL